MSIFDILNEIIQTIRECILDPSPPFSSEILEEDSIENSFMETT